MSEPLSAAADITSSGPPLPLSRATALQAASPAGRGFDAYSVKVWNQEVFNARERQVGP